MVNLIITLQFKVGNLQSTVGNFKTGLFTLFGSDLSGMKLTKVAIYYLIEHS